MNLADLTHVINNFINGLVDILPLWAKLLFVFFALRGLFR